MSSSTTMSNRMQTAHAVLDSYSTLSVPTLLAPLAPNFTHQVLPASMGSPPRDRDAYAKHAAMIFSIFSSFAMVPQSIHEDPASNSVVVYAKMVGELKELGPWLNECVIFMKMSEDGKSVVEYKEFVDSAKANELREKMAKRMGGGNIHQS